MNIFIIEGHKNNADFIMSARSLDNLRVVKMVLETAQLLCTGLNENGVKSPYKSFNPKHPCCKWVIESSENWNNLFLHGQALLDEYKERFNKVHKCKEIMLKCSDLYRPELFLCSNSTPFKMAMPKDFQDENDVVGSYRKYYATKPKMIYPEDKVPSWFVDLRDKIPYKIKTIDGKIKEIK